LESPSTAVAMNQNQSSRSLIPLALSLTLVFGCDPSVRVTGSVVKKDGSPVDGAEISLRCPTQPSSALDGKTDARGGFVLPEGLGCMDGSCTLTVRTTEGIIVRTAIMAYCVEKKFACGVQCSRAEVRVEMP